MCSAHAAPWPQTPAPLTYIPGIPYGEADGMPLLLDILCPHAPPGRPLPTVVHIHGGGWEAGDRFGGNAPQWNPLFAANGFLVASISYRLSGQAPFPAQIHDAKAAVRWLRANAARYGVDPERIGACGHSAGGHLATLLGVTDDLPELEGNGSSPGVSSRVRAVVGVSTPTDFLGRGGLMINDAASPVTRLFGGTVHERADPMRLASSLYHVHPSGAPIPPMLLIHGMEDEIVPVDQSALLRGPARGRRRRHLHPPP